MTQESNGQAAFETLAGEPETPVEARNGIRHMASLTMTKLADGLINPKLVLSYLLNILGAPAVLVSALVPIREAAHFFRKCCSRRVWNVWTRGASCGSRAAWGRGLQPRSSPWRP